MKRATVLLMALLLLPVSARAEQGIIDTLKETADKLLGQGASGIGTSEDAPGEKKGKYLIHFKNGGKLETDNYEVQKDSVKVSLSSGFIYLDKGMIKSIEEVSGPEDETIQMTPIDRPSADRASGPPKLQSQGQRGNGPSETTQPGPVEITDNNGHDQLWWKKRVEEWKKKKSEAEAKYEKARQDWNNYDGTVNSLVSGGDASQYDVIRYQDLRGASRVDMDKYKEAMEEADKMLNEVLPDEARKAGAPPGWAR
ncbi:MAG: hypothetical protein HZA22_00700 [Nitrospirae bacterium]|nr:hypothetical protein [Nitrospirota bacterium]